ncbi:hypothetical protein DFH06DRAFT_1164571 [Mycena polygramma]|nr:hypothetical protein DFH06DRAFT_1164571 [Mycena polygramma]
MASVISLPSATENHLQATQDAASKLMSQLSTDPTIDPDDLQSIQNFYRELEERHAHLNQAVNYDLQDDAPGPTDDEIRAAETERAFKFAKFMTSLDPDDEATKLIIQGSQTILSALEVIENGGSLLVNGGPMEKILDMYESLKVREDKFRTGSGSVSVVDAQIYVTEATAFSENVQWTIMLDMRALTAGKDVMARQATSTASRS